MFQEKDTSKYKYIIYARKSSESEDRQVASIESQIEVMKETAKELGLNIVEVLHESSSGFKTGRPVFNKMMKMLSDGQADGIISWKLSRLSRNPDDAGRLMGMLQREEIKHIRTIDRNWFPEDNVMMMYVEFGVTNQFSRDLSSDTRRGLLKKAERGWAPQTTLPLGYMHSPYKKLGQEEIICDPDRFPIIQKGLKLVASKKYSPREVYKNFFEEGLRTKRGKKISYSVFYRMLTTPLYYGLFEYPNINGKWYEGKHIKAITESEYESIQEALGRKDRERPHKHFFPYSGLMKCGECGCSIVADPKHKTQKNGNVHNYTYYHCTKKREPCSQRCLEVVKLEEQFTDIIERIDIPLSFHEWALGELNKEHEKEKLEIDKSYEDTRILYEKSVKKLDDLVEGWLDKKIPEEVYQRKLPEYEKEKKLLKRTLNNINLSIDERFIEAKDTLNLALRAKERYTNGEPEIKKEIIMNLGSNLILKNLKLDMVVKKPLVVLSNRPLDFDVVIERLEPLEIGYRKEKTPSHNCPLGVLSCINM